LIARYDDCLAVLRDHEHFSSRPPEMLATLRAEFGPFAGASTMLDSDPPAHTRLRRLVSRAFTPRRIKDIEPRIRAIANELLDRIAERGSFDLMEDLASPLPMIVIAEMLGVPPEEHAQFKTWSNNIIEGGRGTFRGVTPGEKVKSNSQELRAYLSAQIERRRREPGEDLITALVQAHDEGGSLSSEELLAFVVLLLLAGNETTTNLIGNGTLALMRHPEQMRRLRDDASLLPTAIDEMLRFDSPVQSTVRTCTVATNVGGTDIAAGELVFVILASANHDARRFAKADDFDVARTPNDHLAFGEGIHFCLGANLARLEGAIAISSMLERFANLRLADPAAPLEYRGSYLLRGLKTLPMLAA
ncbi:MAG TPA: cytochrome P450, partial [Candidatus Binataceae bacterium]|nr:cytochrome P450 [Candidatus Binataceae bacterium]